MFTIRFRTADYRPDVQITLRTSADGWTKDIPGIYVDDAWRFELPEQRYQPAFAFKFVLERSYWMLGQNLTLEPIAGGDYVYGAGEVQFPPIRELVVESGSVQQRFFPPNLNQDHLYDVIVVGSGIGGGILADQLSDLGLDVLVLEAGSYLFPVHVANLPRQHQLGRFDKHVWGLFDEFKVQNYANSFDSAYAGGQAFNLGGRSLFWGGLIPRMSWWESDQWPQEVKWYLEDSGYQRAEDLMNRVPQPPTTYHGEVKRRLRGLLPEFNLFDAPMAVQYQGGPLGAIPGGMFSTADLLLESRLTAGPSGAEGLTVNLNHAVVRIDTANGRATEVIAHDLIADELRTFRGRVVVLAAGTLESAKLAGLSGLNDPSGKLGLGITDHPIVYLHFAVPAGSAYHSGDGASKLLLQHKGAAADKHAYNLILELGADFNQGRYIDRELLARHQQLKGQFTLGELVFLFNAPLLDENRVGGVGSSAEKPLVRMLRSPSVEPYWGEITALKDRLVAELGAVALPGAGLNLADLGGVAHEVGTLRMGAAGAAVVDTDLKFWAYENLYACDLSVFPTSPAANPTLTLAALAIRLADHLAAQLRS
jgi:choline dehydrogenase-like flavoprotein